MPGRLSAALVLGGALFIAACPAASASSEAVAIPPDLSALTQRMETLTVTSERFSMHTGVAIAGKHVPSGLQQLLSLFAVSVAGEAATSPPAGDFKLTFLGHTFTLVVVGGHTYMYEPKLARRDGGRPWIDLGKKGLAALFGGSGSSGAPIEPAAPTSETPFKALAVELAHPETVTELGPGTIDGDAVVGFRETVDMSLLEAEGLVAKGGEGPGPGLLKTATASARAPRSAQIEAFIAPSGLPVRTRVVVGNQEAATTELIDIPAIDFPLTVSPPPPGETITIGALRKLERRLHKRRK